MSAIHEIQQVLTRYCRFVDFGPHEEISGLFTQDGVLEIGDRALEGREAIGAFYRKRAAKDISSRHVLCNLLVTVDGDEAQVNSILLLFRDVGGVVPAVVGDYEDVLVRGPDGWRIRSKRFRVAFRNEALDGGNRQRADVGPMASPSGSA